MQRFIVGDKIVKQGLNGNLEFGYVREAYLDNHLIASWDSGLPSEDIRTIEENIAGNNNNRLINRRPNVVVYDRPLEIGTLIRHAGKNGEVTGTHKVVTAMLIPQDPKSRPIVFPNLKESWLRPVLSCKVGDSVIYKGWTGLCLQGTVDVVYTFQNGANVTLVEDLKTIQETHYVGKTVVKICRAILADGIWSKGFTMLNALMYRNEPSIVTKLTIKSLKITWLEQIRTIRRETIGVPPTEIKDRKEIARVFSLDTNDRDKYSKDAIFMLRWDNELYEFYQTWIQRFEREFIWTDDLYAYGATENEDMDVDEPFVQDHSFTHQDFVPVKVMLSLTEIEILYEDNSVQTLFSRHISDIVCEPLSEITDVPSPDFSYAVGDVVKDRTEYIHSTETKYGFVLRSNYDHRTVTVKWVQCSRDNSVSTEMKEMSQYDIYPASKYRLLKNKPQIVLAKGIFEGVIVGMNLLEGTVQVKCAEGPHRNFYPHELDFMTKIVNYNHIDGSYRIMSTSVVPDTIPCETYWIRNINSVTLRPGPRASNSSQKLFASNDVPWDHSFIVPDTDSDDLLSILDRDQLHQDLENLRTRLSSELQELKRYATTHNYPIWIEKFVTRPDFITIMIIGGADTIYQDVPFLLDFHIDINYPHVAPRVVVRLPPRVFFPNRIHPILNDVGELIISKEIMDDWLDTYRSALGEPEVVYHSTVGVGLGIISRIVYYFMTSVLCSEPYLATVVGSVSHNLAGLSSSNNNNSLDNNNLQSKDLQASRDYNESALLTIFDYIHSILCRPPNGWKEFMENHFFDNLPRMRHKIVKILETSIKDFDGILVDSTDIISMNKQAESNYLIYPLSESFKLAINSRLNNLLPFASSTK